jgi:hypothetical protein
VAEGAPAPRMKRARTSKKRTRRTSKGRTKVMAEVIIFVNMGYSLLGFFMLSSLCKKGVSKQALKGSYQRVIIKLMTFPQSGEDRLHKKYRFHCLF